MLTLKKIAVTGTLSSGKSTVCAILKEAGAYVVSSDDIVHELLSPHTEVGQKVNAYLGTLDRQIIANQVFSNPQALTALEKILHPAVYSEIARQYDEAKKKGLYTLFVAEVPLLFESGGDKYFDRVIHVDAEENRRRERSKLNEEEFTKRNARQLPAKQKAMRADFVIHNNGSLDELKASTCTLLKEIR